MFLAEWRLARVTRNTEVVLLIFLFVRQVVALVATWWRPLATVKQRVGTWIFSLAMAKMVAQLHCRVDPELPPRVGTCL
jgi:hypothetical protein